METKLTDKQIRKEYAIRQFEMSKLRAMQHHALSIAYSAGNSPQYAQEAANTMRRHIQIMDETNDFIDQCLREEAGLL